MSPETANAVIAWTARLSVGFYIAHLTLLPWRMARPKLHPFMRWTWIVGWLTLCAHFIAAFHWRHDWSHAAAVVHTAEQTAAVTGWRWGGGVYVNYAVIIVWAADAFRWMRSKQPSPMTGWQIAWHALLVTIMFNATVVFGPPEWKLWGACLTTLVLGGAVAARSTGRRRASRAHARPGSE